MNKNKQPNKIAKVHERVARGIYRRISSAGQTYYLVFCGKDATGKPVWDTTQTEDAARARRKQVTTARSNEGNSLFALNAEQCAEALKCFRRLKPHNAQLTVAVDFYIDRVLKYTSAPTVANAVAALVKRLEKNNRRPRAIQDAKNRLTKFAAVFGPRHLSAIAPEELESWLDTLSKTAGTRINYQKRLHQLWRFAVRKRWCAENIVELLDPISSDRASVQI